MGNSASSLPYSIDSTVDYTTSDGWNVSSGVQKNDATKVTAWYGKKPLLSTKNTIVTAHHHFGMAKKLRHPHILQVYATLDTDAPTAADASGGDASAGMTPAQTTPLEKQTGDFIIITEPCIPLEEWLNTSPSPQELTWALYCMVQALGFLHNSASLAHGNVSPESWKVTSSGDVKLWNFGISTTSEISRVFQAYEQQATPNSFRSPERQSRDYNLLRSCGIHSMDSYGLGVLMRDVLFLKTGVPATLQKALQRLVSPNPKSRPRVVGLLKCPIFNSPFITLQQELSQVQIQPVEQKISFWQSLNSSLQSVGPQVAVYKLLPLLLSSITTICSSDSLLKQDLYKREVLSMLHILFGIWERYPTEESGLDFVPTIGLLMRVQDRAVRGALLQKMVLLERQFDAAQKHQLNPNVFEPMCSGFSDSSAALRELTLKSSLTLVPHLSPTNLEKLSRYLTRLQSDSEPSIRTNSMVLIIKVAPQLTAVQQEKLLLPSLQRGLNDAFDPCRLACLNAILSYPNFTAEQYATRVLPIVTPKLLDGSSQVRNKAFEVVTKSVAVLKETHETMLREEATAMKESGGIPQPATVGGGATVAAAPTAVAPAPSSGGYLLGFSSWMSSSTKPEATAAGAAPAPVGTGVAPAACGTNVPRPLAAAPQATPSIMSATTNQFAATSLNATPANDDGWDDIDDTNDNEGWGDGELLGINSPPKAAAATKPASLMQQQPKPNLNMQEEEDFFKSFDTKHVPLRSTGGKLAAPSAKKAAPAPKITKLKVDADDWDDF